MLTRDQIKKALAEWDQAWVKHDLKGVMKIFHEDIYFENWTGGRVKGKAALQQAWAPWFADHKGFRFNMEDLFIDETEQKALYQWQLDWPSGEKGYEGKPEQRRGLDILHFKDGKLINKLTY